MKSKHLVGKSSLLVSYPCLLALGVLCILSFFFDNNDIAIVFTPIFLLAFIARAWTFFSSNTIEAALRISSNAVFPGEDISLHFHVENKGFFPIAWFDLYIPFLKIFSLVSNGDISLYDNSSDIMDRSGTRKCGKLSGYGKTDISISLKARKRGIYTLSDCKINTGDGFGLSESSIPIQGAGIVAIYPKIIEVDVGVFLNNLFSLNSSKKGALEDFSSLRSTRDYQYNDSPKHINWRLFARALPLKVNIYENILAKTIHIIFDGESFSSPVPHRKEMEKTISTIASLLLALQSNDIRFYLSICNGKDNDCICISPEESVMDHLFALSAYNPLPVKFDSSGVYAVKQDPVFDFPSILSSNLSVSHFYYFAYDSESIAGNIFDDIDDSKITIVSFSDSGSNDKYRHMSIDVLARDDGYEI